MIAIPRNWLIGIVGSLLVHMMCARAAIRGEPAPPPAAAPIDVAFVDKTPPPPPPPPPQPEKAKTAARSFQRTAAKAGRVLDAAPSPVDDSPVDFSIVEGAADKYVGGTTSARGTSDTPVQGPVTPLAVATTSAAKPASPAGGQWDCSALYPGDGTVLIRAHVDAAGSPLSIDIMRDAPPAFADAARRCAMRQTYRPALDAHGSPTAGVTAPFIVRFHL